MKKLLFTMAALLLLALPSSAMSYEQARQQALFLTDKMAYELNLSEAQYEAAYEINLDYLMSINTVDDLAGNYWRWRNLDMSHVLLEWQYRAFCDAAYFYRPLYWDTGCWHFAIYARYPHRDYYYFGRPSTVSIVAPTPGITTEAAAGTTVATMAVPVLVAECATVSVVATSAMATDIATAAWWLAISTTAPPLAVRPTVPPTAARTIARTTAASPTAAYKVAAKAAPARR